MSVGESKPAAKAKRNKRWDKVAFSDASATYALRSDRVVGKQACFLESLLF